MSGSERSGSRRRWLRGSPGARENLGAAVVAGAVAASVGLTTFYLTRLFLAREPLSGPPGRLPEGDAEPDDGAGGA